MEVDNTDTEVMAPEEESEIDSDSKSNANNSNNDLNEAEKLQVSSDLPNDIDDDDEEDIVLTIRSKKKNKELKILDSESEDEIDGKKHIQDEESKTEIDQNEDSRDLDEQLKDIEQNEESNEEESCKQEKEKEAFRSHNYKALLDSDSDSEPGENADANNISDNGGIKSDTDDENTKSNNKENKKNTVPKRMSAKQAMEQMKAIKSESQRLHRENYVSIPYHQPKQFSLKEFMNRKTICKPNSSDHKRFSLKMSQEELEEFAKQLEEREKEAAAFFKSDNKIKPEGTENCTPSTDKCAAVSENTDAKSSEPIDSYYEEIKISQEKASVDDVLTQQSEEIAQTQEVENPEINETESILDALIDSQSSKIFATQTESQLLTGTCESIIIPETEDEIIIESQENKYTENVKYINKESDSCLKFPNTQDIHQVLKEHNFMDSPVLSGSPEMLIDLESGDVITPKAKGVESLVQRFLKHSVKKKPKETTNMSILSTENGRIEISNVSVVLDDSEITEQKPGAAYTKLKDSLRKVIMKRRKEEIQKRLEENKGSDKENKEGYEENADFEEDEDILDDDEEEFVEEDNKEPNKESHVDEEEGIAEVNAKEEEPDENQSTDADDEYDSHDGDDEDEDDDDDDDDELPEETKAVKSRIISMFDDSDDENEDNLKFELADQQDKPLWVCETNGTQPNPDDEDELLGLCSGRFGETQINVISQIPKTQLQGAPDENELLNLCSGIFQDATQVENTSGVLVENTPISAPKRLESSDEENEEDRKPKLNAKQKKVRKLGFSDDEEDDDDYETHEAIEDDVEEQEEFPAGEEEIEEDEMPETYVDYDSEENEVEVKMTKTDKREKASEFFEKEAELSESEWGSADEDEKDLDRYEIDLADEEQFDRAKLQSELGKIHMRRILDDDIREVKKLQEMLIEDEETDGIGRQRQFRWKFLNDGFEFETGVTDDTEGGDLNIDEEDEILWRKMRYEREMLLKKNEEKLSSEEPQLKPQVTIGSGKKITIVNINSTSTTTVAQSSSPFLITNKMNVSRGSFLIRDNDTLSKLANITKASGEQEAGSVRAAKSQNFVFASLDRPEDKKTLKRKSNGEQETEINQRKKPKLNTKKKIRLIDQLA